MLGEGFHEHNGGTGGSRSFMAWDPRRKIRVALLANAIVNIDEVGLQLMGTNDLFFSDLIFLVTSIAFMVLLANLLAAQKKRRIKTTWEIGVLWLLLAVPFAITFSRFWTEGRGVETLLPLSLVLLYMLAKVLLDFVLRIDLRQNRTIRIAYLTLMCLALFSLIWIPFSIHSAWVIPVLIAVGILMTCLIFLYRNEVWARQ